MSADPDGTRDPGTSQTPQPIGQPMEVNINKLIFKLGRQLIELDAYAEMNDKMAVEIRELRAQTSLCTCAAQVMGGLESELD